jgi:hypothetical protein
MEDDQEEESVQSEKDDMQEVKTGRSILSFQPKPEGRTRSGRVYKDIVAIAQERSNPKTNDKAYDEPETFVEAWNHPNSDERNGWRQAIKKEFNDMNSKNVWQKVKRENIPHNKRLIGNKWVFKKNKDGRFRARTVFEYLPEKAELRDKNDIIEKHYQ